MGLGLEGAALLELLPNPAHRRHTKTKKLRDVAGALALFVELDDSLPGRQWDRSHAHTLPHRSAFVKLHNLWKCSRRQWPSFAWLDPGWRASGFFPKKNPPLCQGHPAGAPKGLWQFMLTLAHYVTFP